MSIFSRTRTPDEADQARTAVAAGTDAPAQHEQATGLVPPAAAGAAARAPAAGVVPPPAAPMYSMRRPDPARVHDDDVEDTVAERLRMAREALQRAQVSVEGSLEGHVAGRMRVAARRDATPASAAARRPAPRPTALVPRPARPQQGAHTAFDATRAAQTGLLNLAWSWQQAGSPIRAIHAYMQVLERYPDTAAADAAVADLVEISDKLAAQGQFHTALAIYDRLEELLA